MLLNETEKPATPELKKDWRFYSGMTALILACVVPLLAFAVPLLNLSTAASATVVGVLVLGGPEVLLVLAAALLGKETFSYFIARAKQAIWNLLSPKPASKTCTPV